MPTRNSRGRFAKKSTGTRKRNNSGRFAKGRKDRKNTRKSTRKNNRK